MSKKTAKFTYEGSSKLIKVIFLIGKGICSIGNVFFIFSIFFALYYTWLCIQDKTLSEEIFIDNFVIMIPPIMVYMFGQFLICIAQFLNWWDRGSINSKIFRKPK